MDAAEDTSKDINTPDINLSGSARAAILLMALGEEEASSILQFMEPAEVQNIGEAMAAINGVSQDEIGHTLDHFIGRIGKESSLGFGSTDYFKSTLTKAVGGEILNSLPAELHSDLIIRISELDTLHPSALTELDEIIKKASENNADVEISGIGGISAASEILNGVSKEAEERIFEEIEALDSELCEKIKEGMFIFENLLTLDDRGMQTLLRDVNNEQLILALKGATSEMQAKIFTNMSSRAAELLKDDLDAKGPVKLSEVEESQREILVVAHQLAEDGKIALSSKGDDFV